MGSPLAAALPWVVASGLGGALLLVEESPSGEGLLLGVGLALAEALAWAQACMSDTALLLVAESVSDMASEWAAPWVWGTASA